MLHEQIAATHAKINAEALIDREKGGMSVH
jgi:hypothetical protein